MTALYEARNYHAPMTSLYIHIYVYIIINCTLYYIDNARCICVIGRVTLFFIKTFFPVAADDTSWAAENEKSQPLRFIYVIMCYRYLSAQRWEQVYEKINLSQL